MDMERGDNLELVRKHGPPKLAEEGQQFLFVLASPQCPVELDWCSSFIIGLVEELLESYLIDPNRVYLAGLSVGGYGSWQMPLGYPGRFAAIVPICGGESNINLPFMERLRSLPIWDIHDTGDDVLPHQESVWMVEKVNATGGNAKLTTFYENSHDSWTAAYANPELYDWMLSTARNR
jgi:predicted peptidase